MSPIYVTTYKLTTSKFIHSQEGYIRVNLRVWDIHGNQETWIERGVNTMTHNINTAISKYCGLVISCLFLIMTCIFWQVTYSTILLAVWKCRSVGAKFFLLFEERNRYQNLQSSVELNQFPSFNLICAACLVFLIEKFVNAVVPPWGGCFKENTWGWIVVSVISVTPIVFDSYRLSTGFSHFFLSRLNLSRIFTNFNC